MLTPLQERTATIVLQASEDPLLALSGGAAIIVRRIVDRTTSDLDFFTPVEGVDSLVSGIVGSLQSAGLNIELEQNTSTFARLLVSDGTEDVRVDIAVDYRMMPAEPGPFGPMVSSDELAADKLLALWSRALPRDFVDVLHLAARHGRERLLELAGRKDPGFRPMLMADALQAIARLPRSDFEVDDETFDALLRFFADWRTELTGSPRP